MSESWLAVVAIAFVAQLAVLPGEKVQFIIAGLSTRYDPLLVVAAAGTAFAGWTAVEIAFGRALKDAVPGVYLDALTAFLFALFAIMLVRSAPAPGESMAEASEEAPPPAETDGGAATGGSGDTRAMTGEDDGATPTGSGDGPHGDSPEVTIVGWTVPDYFGGFLPIFAMMAAGEFGDKTQLITFSLATQYAAHPTGIWVGEMLAIIPVSLANAYVFHRYAHRVSLRKAHFAGAALFAFFAFDTVLGLATGPEAVFGHNSLWEAIVNALSRVLLAVV